MDDKDIPLDTARQAVRLVELEGQINALQQMTSSSLEHIRETLVTMGKSVEGLANSMQQVAAQQIANARDRQDVADLRRDLAATNGAHTVLTRRVNVWQGVFLAFGLIGGALVAGFLYNVSQWREYDASQRLRLEAVTLENRRLIDQIRDRQHEQELREARNTREENEK